MGSTENLQGQQAVTKIKEIAEKVNICLFATNLGVTPIAARPMSTNTVDADGTIWFFSGKDSDTNKEINKDSRVQLFYSNTASSEYLSLYGTATIVTDQKKVEELWSPINKTWFNDGTKDPNISLLKITPQEGHYWDTKHNKVVQMAKIAFGAIAGKPSDDGLQGTVSL